MTENQERLPPISALLLHQSTLTLSSTTSPSYHNITTNNTSTINSNLKIFNKNGTITLPLPGNNTSKNTSILDTADTVCYNNKYGLVSGTPLSTTNTAINNNNNNNNNYYHPHNHKNYYPETPLKNKINNTLSIDIASINKLNVLQDTLSAGFNKENNNSRTTFTTNKLEFQLHNDNNATVHHKNSPTTNMLNIHKKRSISNVTSSIISESPAYERKFVTSFVPAEATTITTKTASASASSSSSSASTPNSSSSSKTVQTFAFISHSQDTFPSDEPSIDNAQLARRKRRRTSKQELSILETEFNNNPTPTKDKRHEIALKCNMSEQSVQIWFQNKRQNVKKRKLKLKKQDAFITSNSNNSKKKRSIIILKNNHKNIASSFQNINGNINKDNETCSEGSSTHTSPIGTPKILGVETTKNGIVNNNSHISDITTGSLYTSFSVNSNISPLLNTPLKYDTKVLSFINESSATTPSINSSTTAVVNKNSINQ
ncbi:Yhp1p SCDLUD_004936 [Saccharomycodes ludwigii]|uniref:Yhp1p n=1 Tax=Saccharomycodes ludwigii TaxID=36035 RepID=UPI001E866225|nr:hypothetical protein SCDLUD_004936 [Saccharomycodes ludwigii]KAH3899491.1 hypothetical protein SCDLUD_004936 [Saccharomycodes ludwigii]